METQTTVRSGMGVKLKTAGAIFDGGARLTFSIRKGTSRNATSDHPAVPRAYARLGFQALVEAHDSVEVEQPRTFRAIGARGAV